MKTFLRNMAIVVAKEIMDALRDRRTLLRLLVPAVLMGPLLLLAVSGLISSLEDRAEKHEVLVAGMEHAPSLRNYLERQTYTIKTAPPDYEAACTHPPCWSRCWSSNHRLSAICWKASAPQWNW